MPGQYVRASIPKEEIESAAKRQYEGEPFVRVPRGRLPEVVAVAGSNYAEVAIVAGPPPPPEALDRPRVRVVKQGDGPLAADTVVDLAAEGAPRVARAVAPGAVFADATEHVAAL